MIIFKHPFEVLGGGGGGVSFLFVKRPMFGTVLVDRFLKMSFQSSAMVDEDGRGSSGRRCGS